MAPTTSQAPTMNPVNGPETTATSSQGIAGSVVSSLFNA